MANIKLKFVPAEKFKATMQLRWVERRNIYGRMVNYQKVLQQLWLGTAGTKQWRDVPFENE